MPLRLSELLERIRPAGTPGAASEGEQQHERFDRTQEIAEVAAILATFDDEAAATVARATTQATMLDHTSEARARQIQAAVPDLIATAQAAAVVQRHTNDQAERNRMMTRAEAEIERLRQNAAVLMPQLVAAAADAVWAIIDTESTARGLP